MTATGAVTAPVERDRFAVGTCLTLFAIGTLVFTHAFSWFLELHASSDLSAHLAYAQRIRSLADVVTPHFLFELLVKAGYVAGFSYHAAAVWLLGVCYGGMAALIGYEMYRRRIAPTPLLAIVLVMAALLASHIFVFTFDSNVYRGYFVPTAYHSPTQQLNKLLALWIYFLYGRHFLGAERASWSSVPLLALLCILSAIAKPSFLIAFLPAAALFAMHDLVRRRWRQALLCLLAIGIPSALTLLWQTKLTDDAGQSILIAFRPFVVFDAGETVYKLPLSLAFPLMVVAGAWWTHGSDARLRFIWTFVVIALFITLCIVENDHKMMHGNFAWTGQTGVFLAYVESLLFLLTQPRRGWTHAAWILFAVHVISGLYWYGLVFDPDWRRVV